MPKMSKERAAHVDELGTAEDRHDDLGEYTVDFISSSRGMDLAPLLKGLPDDRCQCPHWGFVFKGRVAVDYADRSEVYEAGDAFYMPPGHVRSVEPGTELVQFSNTQELAATARVMKRHMLDRENAVWTDG